MRTYEPSPDHRVREQVARYEATGGREGATLPHVPEYRAGAGGRDIPIMLLEPMIPAGGDTARHQEATS